MMNKMLFSNNSNYNGQAQAQRTYQQNISRAPISPATLNSKMIERIHKTKPGCSACGKKVV